MMKKGSREDTGLHIQRTREHDRKDKRQATRAAHVETLIQRAEEELRCLIKLLNPLPGEEEQRSCDGAGGSSYRRTMKWCLALGDLISVSTKGIKRTLWTHCAREKGDV